MVVHALELFASVKGFCLYQTFGESPWNLKRWNGPKINPDSSHADLGSCPAIFSAWKEEWDPTR